MWVEKFGRCCVCWWCFGYLGGWLGSGVRKLGVGFGDFFFCWVEGFKKRYFVGLGFCG